METSAMETTDPATLIHRYLAAYNAFDVGGMLALLSPEVRFENYSGDELTAEASGIDEFRLLAEQAKAVFAEREQRITALASQDGIIIASIAFRGRLGADIPDGPRAGTILDLDGRTEFSFRDGMIEQIIDRSD